MGLSASVGISVSIGLCAPLQAAESDNRNWYQQAENAREQKDWDSCAGLYLKAAEASPQLWQAWAGRAVCLSELDELDEALLATNRALAGEPFSIELLQLKVNIQSRQSKPGEALKSHRYIIEAAENNTAQLAEPRNRSSYAQSLVKVAMHELEHGDYRQAYELIIQVPLVLPDDPWAWHAKATFFLQAKLYDQALDPIERALSMDPGNPDYLKTRGEVLLFAGQYGGALESLDRAVSADPGDAESYYRRAQSYALLGKRDAMLADLQTALQLDPSLENRARTPSGYDLGFSEFADDVQLKELLTREPSSVTDAS